MILTTVSKNVRQIGPYRARRRKPGEWIVTDTRPDKDKGAEFLGRCENIAQVKQTIQNAMDREQEMLKFCGAEGVGCASCAGDGLDMCLGH